MTGMGRLRNGVVAGATPGVAAEDAADGQVGTLEGPVLTKGLNGILGTRGGEPARRRLERRNANLVKFHKENQRENRNLLKHRFSLIRHSADTSFSEAFTLSEI